jgi:cell division protein FtsI (penicillin-binding protein 3)
MLLAIGFVLTLFGGRLVQLQGMQSAKFRTAAEKERLTKQALQGVRGTIFSADGQPLAMTVETYTVTADPTQMAAADMPKYASKLARPLGTTSQQVLAGLRKPQEPRWEPLSPAGGVPATADAKIEALGIPGITSAVNYTRTYPDGTPTANLVGFASTSDNVTVGKQGLEQQYNRLLSGRDGSEEVYKGTNGVTIPLEGGTVMPATNGSSITLTINSALQYEAQQACHKQVDAMKARDCTVVIMKPGTGDVLAMAQWPPSFQPGAPASQPCQTSSAAASNPLCWTDLPVQAVFEPGSTAKVITAAAALEHGDPKQTPMTPYNIPYGILEGGQVIHDSEWHSGERYTIAGIIANSSNVGMAQVANTISPQLQYQYLKAFGLDQPTGLGLPLEATGTLPTPAQWWPDERYTLAYGQGIDVNAVQMASVYATLANGGVRVTPRIVAGTTSPSGKYTPAPASSSQRVVKATTATDLLQILQQVPGVDESANVPWGIIPGYAIASKTGTSNESGPSCPDKLCEYGSSYIGMAPGDDPQVVVAVNVQDPKKKNAYFGDIVAGPVFYQVMKSAIQTLQIQPDDPTVPYVRLNAP